MWLKLGTISTLLLFIQDVTGETCRFTVSVLDRPGVQCVSKVPCSGTYFASGLSQGVGACPADSSCALLPSTPIMGCAITGRKDIIYVNVDGTLTKDGQSVTLLGAPMSTSDHSTTNSARGSSSSIEEKRRESNTDSRSPKSDTSSTSSGSKANSRLETTTNTFGGGEDASNTRPRDNVTSLKGSTLNSLSSESESESDSHAVPLGSSSANQQAEFNPGSIMSDGPNTSKSSSSGGLGLGAIIAIVVGCLAAVAIAAGARLLKKGKEAELVTPGAAGGLEAYDNVDGGGGGGMTPKENVLLL